jgi:hypothetical protein
MVHTHAECRQYEMTVNRKEVNGINLAGGVRSMQTLRENR